MIRRLIAAAAAATLALAAPADAQRSRGGESAPAPAAAAPADATAVKPASVAPTALPPAALMLPPRASAPLSITLKGRALAYHATAGAIPIYDAQGRMIAQVGYTSFTLDGRPAAKRPVTFAFAGGPGSSSGSLALALGPKTVAVGHQGITPSTPLELVDNPDTWLAFTDLVVIDPVGTGFSRAFEPDDAAARDFYGVDQDVRYLSEVVLEWLKAEQRMPSPKYVLGESYGGFRTPRMVEQLDSWTGVGVSGLILVSPILDFNIKTATGTSLETLSPMSYAVDLPSMTAANYERQGKTLTPELMAPVEDYARGEFLTALIKGDADPVGFDRMVAQVADYTGLPPARVRELGGRLEQSVYLREAQRPAGLVGSRYDINWTSRDAFPWSNASKGQDMVVETFNAESAGMVDLLTRVIGWRPQGVYKPFSPPVAAAWGGQQRNTESLTALRHDLALDANFKLLIVHGYTDLSCSYLMSRMAVDQMPRALKGARVTLKVFPGGHMFYDRPGSGLAFRDAAAQLYQ